MSTDNGQGGFGQRGALVGDLLLLLPPLACRRFCALDVRVSDSDGDEDGEIVMKWARCWETCCFSGPHFA